MCRIASIFLLQRLKGSMSGDARGFIAAAKTWLDGQPSEFFFEWFEKVRATD